MAEVQTYRGPIEATGLGVTLIHEHVFVRDRELAANYPDPEWQEAEAVERAVAAFTALHALGVRTIVDLTVPGLGRDPSLVASVAARVPVHIIAATGWYTPDSLPLYFRFHGPGRLIDRPDPLVDYFVRDIAEGIAGTSVRAGMLKVMSDDRGISPDAARVMAAAAEAHEQTGIPITTHSVPASRNGLEQQAFLRERSVDPSRIIIGHSGDSEDVDYLRTLMDGGSTIGMDRFGMEHVLPDDRRATTVLALLRLGYADRMILSHDAAIYSHVTPPSWRGSHAPHWHMADIHRRVIPMLRAGGASDRELEQMLVLNPRRLLGPASGDAAGVGGDGPAVESLG